ncbi:MAG: hypothetical protein GTO02_21490, partial [Candidatus Dadabacteria bacterium]|nr:hypothetical protein [Candidatus Dadabacteria bacterium]
MVEIISAKNVVTQKLELKEELKEENVKHNYPKRTIQELNNQYQGETVFIVGTGPSMRLFPVDLLAGKITIGLNQAWKLFRPTYLLTIHPEVLPPNTRTTHIITKEKGNLTGQEPYIFFRN